MLQFDPRDLGVEPAARQVLAELVLPVFDLVPPDQAWMFAKNSRLTAEQLASANKVCEHAIESEERVRQRTLPNPE